MLCHYIMCLCPVKYLSVIEKGALKMENQMKEKKFTGYPSIDKPWFKYYSEDAINAPLPECTMYEYTSTTKIKIT